MYVRVIVVDWGLRLGAGPSSSISFAATEAKASIQVKKHVRGLDRGERCGGSTGYKPM